MDDITAERKIQLAAKYAQLNEILSQRRKILTEIGSLMERANELQKRADELDEQFHRMAIKVEPTEIIDIRKKDKPDTNKLISSIMSKLEESPPDLRAQLEKILANT